MKLRFFHLLLFSLLAVAQLHADEGMWLPGRIGKRVGKAMKAGGLELSVDEVCSNSAPSLKDAVVSFGGFCSGVVVSTDGLVLTNHHCGFESIQNNTMYSGKDLINDGFVAQSRDEELQCYGLYVRFLIRTEDVTKRVLRAVSRKMNEDDREAVIDSVATVIATEASAGDTTLVGVVDSFYGGNEYVLSVYRDYNDVRLVFAPPRSIGAFGWDRDNWMWPRHTGDFCVFRIYADSDNRPAFYSKDNVPYTPDRVAKVSLDGYKEGDFCMTMGYPGETDRMLSSYGTEEMVECTNSAIIDVRGLKLGIMREAMALDSIIATMYSGKYESSSNFYKYAVENNKAIKRLKVIERKRATEQAVAARNRKVDALLKQLEEAYDARREIRRVLAYYEEAFFGGAELPTLALMLMNVDREADSVREAKEEALRLINSYVNYYAGLDKVLFEVMADLYRSKVDDMYLPVFYHEADTLCGGDMSIYADSLYAKTVVPYRDVLEGVLEGDTTVNVVDDPASNLAMELLFFYYYLNTETMDADETVKRCERELTEAMRSRMVSSADEYSDANSTMRLSYGSVQGYAPADGVDYNYFTTTKGIMQKAVEFADDPDFELRPALARLLSERDFGRFTDSDGDMHVCFISNNDITGGNSGSAMFNGRGELIGLAFDGNSEAISGDLLFEPSLQRCVGVDIRYVLFIMEKYGKAAGLVEEILGSR